MEELLGHLDVSIRVSPNFGFSNSIVRFLKSDSISRWLSSDFALHKVRKVSGSFVSTIPNPQEQIPGFALGLTHELSFWAEESLVRQLLDEDWFKDRRVRVCFYENKKEVISS